jgi:hypothetical protein
VADLMDGLKADFEIRGKVESSGQNECRTRSVGIRRHSGHSSHRRAD